MPTPFNNRIYFYFCPLLVLPLEIFLRNAGMKAGHIFGKDRPVKNIS
jgi:hypothetical protein